MTPFEKLSEKDQELIEDYISAFAEKGDSEEVYTNRRRSLDVVLKEWDAEKRTLFSLLGNELIQRRLFVYKQNPEGLKNTFELHHEDEQRKAFINWWAWDVKHNSKVKFTIELSDGPCTTFSKFFYIEEAFSDKSLAENAYTGPDYKVVFEDGTYLKISSGMKPMKILHKFIERYGDAEAQKMFEEFRIWQSQLLNQKTVDGELCLSIHPLDYMTMSNNDNGWTSCMRWADKWGSTDHGDYCAGTIECMNSPYILVAYLHNPKHSYKALNHWEWNSKQWRELFIVRDGVIAEIKAYPYQDENLTNGCITWIKELAANNMGWTYDDEEVDVAKSIIHDNAEYLLDFQKSTYMYKDIGVLKKHAGRLNYDSLRNSKKFDVWSQYEGHPDRRPVYMPIVPYGGVATCMFCGQIYENDDLENSLLCGDCEYTPCCALCGEPLNGDHYWIDELDGDICEGCYEDKTMTDSFSDETHLSEDMENLSLLLGYDYNDKPVYFDEWAACYHPEDNWSYDDVMKERPKYENYHTYVTLDMVREGKERQFADAFNIWFGWDKKVDLMNKYYQWIDEYSLCYDWNHNELFPEEDEENDMV